jgi:uncharacterized SAM-binding protein YcdF (DUF218 family)
MSYALRRLISLLLFPLPVTLGLLVTGLVLLWFTRRQKAGKVIVTVGVLLLMVIGYQPVVRGLLSGLENRHLTPGLVDQGAEFKAPRWIVVLGGGFTPDRRLPVTSQLAPSTLARLVEGVRLYKRFPGSKVIVSGGRAPGIGPEAVPIGQVAELLGVSPTDLVLESESADTEDQARLVQKIVGTESFLLVTAASHMPRAHALFTKRGMHPIPAPADFDIKGSPEFTASDLFPRGENVRRSEEVAYEYLGFLWGRLRGAL